MGQWDLNPRPPAPQAYTSTELVSLTKLDDGPSKSENKGLLLNLKNALGGNENYIIVPQ